MADRLLIIDDDDSLRESLQLVLTAEGFQVDTAADGVRALQSIERDAYDLILCDLRMPGIGGLELLPQLIQRRPEATVILMSAYGTEELALEAIHRGAYDYLAKPFQPSEALFTLRKAQERERLRRANQVLRHEVSRARGDAPVIAASPPMLRLLDLVDRTASYKTTILLTGESGTGKEVLARRIHERSPRAAESFVGVNCGAIPEALLESELFGHARGAFTGAERNQPGLFREADGGTLFLDEIGELSPPLQVKLLRVLQEEEVRPVGEVRARPVNVRVIAATARDLEAEVARQRFREDLFYRLNVVRLKVPPLRDRAEDIPLLIDHFIERFGQLLGKRVQGVDAEALERMQNYAWPGNVRELENVIERAVILADQAQISLRELPENVIASPRSPASGESNLSLRDARRRAEIAAIRQALQITGGNRTHAARLLSVSHRALLYKLKEYGIHS